MDKKIKFETIKTAQRYLVKHPKDPLHDLTHHYRTLLIAKEIASNINDKPEMDLLEILCWWHDVMVSTSYNPKDRSAKITADCLAKLLPIEYRDNVLDSIENHEFKLHPKYLEGKILQDADKLDLLSKERISGAIDAVEAGYISKTSLLKDYEEITKNWLPQMPKLYNFSYSRKLHFKIIENSQKDIENLKNYLSNKN